MAKLTRLTDKEWKTLKSEYESGSYLSLEDFYKRYVVENLSKRPGFEYLQNVAAKQGWTKHANAPKIAAECERLSVEMYARFGLTPQRAAQILAKATEDVMVTRDTLIAEIRALATAGSEFDMTRLEALADLAKKYIADKKAAAPYLVEYHKVTGAHAAQKHEHSGKVSVSNDFAGMTPAELIADAKARLARLDALLAKGDAPWQPKQQ